MSGTSFYTALGDWWESMFHISTIVYVIIALVIVILTRSFFRYLAFIEAINAETRRLQSREQTRRA